MPETKGDQLPLLLIPGMMCDARLFAPQVAALSQLCPVEVVMATDHDSMGALAADILTHAPQRFALGGLSMGGILAMEIVRQAPERVARLALLDTNPRAELPEVQARRAPQMQAARDGGLAGVMTGQMIPLYAPEGAATPDLDALALDMALSLGPEVFVRQSLALRDRPDQIATLAGYDGVSLVLMGEGDRLCPRDRHDQMADLLPRSELVIIPGAGHLPTLQTPDAVTEAMTRWLTR